MDKFIKKKREDWKGSYSKTVKSSKDIHKATERIIAEYIYYSGRVREVKTRIKRIIKMMEFQMDTMSSSREDINPRELGEIKKDLQKLKKKL